MILIKIIEIILHLPSHITSHISIPNRMLWVATSLCRGLQTTGCVWNLRPTSRKGSREEFFTYLISSVSFASISFGVLAVGLQSWANFIVVSIIILVVLFLL